jgi:heme A synthase
MAQPLMFMMMMIKIWDLSTGVLSPGLSSPKWNVCFTSSIDVTS